MKRIPRKLKKQIPSGLYCYKGLSFDMKTGIYHIKSCKFFKYEKIENIIQYLDKFTKEIENDEKYLKSKIGFCHLIKCEIDDQCKSCNL